MSFYGPLTLISWNEHLDKWEMIFLQDYFPDIKAMHFFSAKKAKKH